MALRHSGLLLSNIFMCIAASIADPSADVFKKPPGGGYGNFALNAVYHADDDIEFEWLQGYGTIDLLLRRVDLTNLSLPMDQWVLKSAATVNNFTWSSAGREGYLNDPEYSLDTVFVASLSFVGANTTMMRTASHYFNVTRKVSSQISATPTVTNSPVIGLSKNAIAGISAVSAAVLISAIMCIAVLVLRKRSRRRNVRSRALTQMSSRQSERRPPMSKVEVFEKSGSGSCASDASWEQNHAQLGGQPVVIAELPGSFPFLSELPTFWGSRRSGDSWDPFVDEMLDVVPRSAAQHDRDECSGDGDGKEVKESEAAAQDMVLPTTPPPEYSICSSNSLEPFTGRFLESEQAVEEHVKSTVEESRTEETHGR
ncbi:hypothetical protein IF2G_10591 [Cordyceps javanica]|nr:hypothetical protein IF2G_10591 [Cordyceps javanica]